MTPTVTQKPIAEAQPHELRSYATNFLNLEMTGSESDADVLALIQRASPGIEQIFIMQMPTGDEPAAGTFDVAAETPVERMSGSTGRGDPRVTINIPFTGEDNIGRADVGVGVNGVVWQIRRGVDVEVPWRVVEALGLTEQDIIRHDMERDEVLVTKAMRFPINFPRGMPSPEAIRAWRERTDAAFCP